MHNNRDALKAWLKRLRWSQRHLAEWLTERGSPVSVSTVERWLADPNSRSRQSCPSWPIEMIENAHPRSSVMHTITLANQKGGVGKSTLACHTAFDLEERGYSVLFLDLDTQGNSTKVLADRSLEIASSTLFESNQTIPKADRIGLVGADTNLSKLDRAPYSVIETLKSNLEACSSSYDYCIIDTPPTVGLRLSAALAVSDYVLSPIELEQFSIDGIERMLKTIFGMKKKINPNLQFLGMVPNRFDPRSQRQKDALSALIQNYADYLIQQPIGIRVTIPEALGIGEPVWNIKKTSARDAGKQIKEALGLVYAKMGVNHG